MEQMIAGFGEVMLRLCPEGKNRFSQALPGELQATFGGAEVNVCVSLAELGLPSRFVTALPDNPITRALATQLRGIGVDVSQILYRNTGRLGIYYAEQGTNMRGSSVIYDREGSTISALPAGEYPWESLLAGVTCLHLTGITPALSRSAFESTLSVAKYAAEHGIQVAIDLNYRKKLWNWEPRRSKQELARDCMSQIVTFADIIIGSDGEIDDVFGIRAQCTEASCRMNVKGYTEIAQALSAKFPKAKYVAFPYRHSFSADSNQWGGMLYDCKAQKSYCAPVDANGNYVPYEIGDVVDSFGAGDAFAAGLLYALYSGKYAQPEEAVRFAVAAGALKHTIPGDFNRVSCSEVENLMGGAVSGGMQR